MMAWTNEKVRAMRTLWASNWSTDAIALALGMTRGAIAGKQHRLRRDDCVEFALACVRRKLIEVGGGEVMSVRRAREILSEPGALAKVLEAA